MRPTTTFVQDLKTCMSKLQFTLWRLTSRQKYIPKTLFDSEYVFVRDDAINNHLYTSYQGPYKGIKTTILKNGKNDTISIGRIKKNSCN